MKSEKFNQIIEERLEKCKYSPNGRICLDCYNIEFPEYDTNEYWKAVANHVLQMVRRLIEYYESEVE